MRHTTLPARRAGFTLMELMVVIALIIVIAAITVAISQSGAFGSQRVISGADRVSGWLAMAKNRAVRDNAPRGLRFFITPQTSNRPDTVGHVQEMQYIEQPELWVPNPSREPLLVGVPGAPPSSAIVFATVVAGRDGMGNGIPTGSIPGQVLEQWVYFITNNQDIANDFDVRINPGDFLVLPEHAGNYRITAILNPVDASLSLPLGISATMPFRPFQLGDANTNTIIPVPNAYSVRQLVLATSPYRTTLTSTAYGLTERPEPDLGAAGIAYNLQPASPPYARWASKLTHDFGFQAAPRPLMGEPILTLTANTIIDCRAPLAGAYPVTGPGPFWPQTTTGVNIPLAPVNETMPAWFDIVFSPSGQVLNNPNSLIALWIRDPEKVRHPRLGDPPPNNIPGPPSTQLDRMQEFETAGEQVLVVVYTKTGLIATHPIVPPPAVASPAYDPYRFAKDGANSGF